MNRSAKILQAIGYTWIVLSIGYLIWRFGIVLLNENIPFVKGALSLVNIWNILFSLLVLLPGIICILVSKK